MSKYEEYMRVNKEYQEAHADGSNYDVDGIQFYMRREAYCFGYQDGVKDSMDHQIATPALVEIMKDILKLDKKGDDSYWKGVNDVFDIINRHIREYRQASDE